MATQKQSETKYYTIVLVVIAGICGMSIGGYVLLLALGKAPAPELLNLAFATGGALGGSLLKPNSTNAADGNNTSDILSTLGEKAALQIVEDALKRRE